MWLYSGSIAWLITQQMRGEGDPANSLSLILPLGFYSWTGPRPGDSETSYDVRELCKNTRVTAVNTNN